VPRSPNLCSVCAVSRLKPHTAPPPKQVNIAHRVRRQWAKQVAIVWDISPRCPTVAAILRTNAEGNK
jgi:hypothetical protein